MDESSVPFIESVFHPSDFSEASASAFAHALAVALRRQAQFTVLHVAGDGAQSEVWTKFPPVRTTLERWGLLEQDSPRSAVFESLGISVKKISLRGGDVVGAVAGFLRHEPSDLIVLSTEGREGLPRWLQRSMAERLARRTKMMTLFVPRAARGIVSVDDGSISLRRILVPVDHEPDPQLSAIYAGRAAGMADGDVEVTLLHVGTAGTMSEIRFPEVPRCSWQMLTRPGDVVEQIAAAAEQRSPDLIIMPTQGREGILDALRGTVTEKVLRRCSCPLLAVPVG